MTKTILAVDDSKTIRQAIEWTFLASEFSVRTAESASDALAQLGVAAPDLVLVDVSLPDQDGYQVARSIRAQQPNLPIVLLTSSHSAFDPDHAEASGVSAHIGKPFDTQALLDLVESQLAAASAEPPVPVHAIPEMPAPLGASMPAMPPATPPTAAVDGSDGLELDPFADPGSASAWDDAVQADAGWGQADAGPQLEPPPPPSSAATAEPVDVWALSEEVPADDAEVIEDIDIEDVPDEEFMPAPAPAATPEPVAPSPVSVDSTGFGAPQADPMPSWDPAPPAPPAPQPPPPQPPPSAAPALGSALAATAAPGVADAAAAQLPAGLSREALEQMARQVIEQVAWEVVPELAEVIIREELARLTEDEESVRKPD